MIAPAAAFQFCVRREIVNAAANHQRDTNQPKHRQQKRTAKIHATTL